MKITTISAVSILLSISSYAGGGMVPVEPELSIAPVMETEKNDWFIYAAGGLANLDVTSFVTPGSELKNGALDDKVSLYELGLGYRFTENIFATLAAQRSELDFADIDTIYGSINYQFSDVMLKPYLGLVGGYSTLGISQK